MKKILNQDDDDDDLLYIRGTIDRLLPFCKYLQNTRNLTNTLLCCRLHGERGPKKGRKVVLLPPFRWGPQGYCYGWVICLDLLFQSLHVDGASNFLSYTWVALHIVAYTSLAQKTHTQIQVHSTGLKWGLG